MKRIIFTLISLLLFCNIMVFASEPPMYDVIVIGSDPEGIAAAVSASRAGAKVLLIDKRNELGGLYTSGMLSMLDMNYVKANSMEVVNQGFFSEFYSRVGDNASFDIEQTKLYFTNLLRNNQVNSILGISTYEPKMDGNDVKGVIFSKNSQYVYVSSHIVIDATHDAQFARQAGAPYIVGREDLGVKNEYAAATLVFSVDGVDWSTVMRYLNGDQSIYTGANSRVAWGYEQMLQYTGTSSRIQLRRLNLSRQKDDSVVINALQIFGVDSLDEQSKQESYQLALQELSHVVQFLRQRAPGFEKATLHKAASELYIREGVRIIGENMLTGEDVFTNKNYWNKIGYGSYPTDLQATRRDFSGGNILTGRNLYTLPFGIMLPKSINNLLVVGRSASYDSIAHSSARTVPVGIALGQAAGIGAAYSINNHISLKQINESAFHIQHVQNNLRQVGVNLDTPLPTNHPEKEVWAYPYIQHLRSQGLLSKEHQYVNDYYCYEVATNNTLQRIITLIKQNSTLPVSNVVFNSAYDNYITKVGALDIVNQLLGETYVSYNELFDNDVIDNTVRNYIMGANVLTNAHMYALMDNVVNYVREQHHMPVPSIEEIIRYDIPSLPITE